MELPPSPIPRTVSTISHSLYEALSACKAKAVWLKFGDRALVPETPKSIIGICFHKVMEASSSGKLPNDIAFEGAAKRTFDDEAQRLYESAHVLLRNKYPTRLHLPNYFLQRERATVAARRFIRSSVKGPSRPIPSGTGLSPHPEQRLSSRDGRLVGTVDFIDLPKREIVDYKTGTTAEGGRDEPSERELRQLQFYAYLAREQGIEISSGSIVRANGKKHSVAIDIKSPDALAESARSLLADFNHDVNSGKAFSDWRTFKRRLLVLSVYSVL